jgi:hypothetical protein
MKEVACGWFMQINLTKTSSTITHTHYSGTQPPPKSLLTYLPVSDTNTEPYNDNLRLFSFALDLCLHRRKIRLTEGSAKFLRLKSNLEKDFATAVSLSEQPSSPRLFVLGWASNFVDSKFGPIFVHCTVQY